MLTQTSELAIQTLLFLGLEGGNKPLSPRQISESIKCSPSYLAKTVRMLVRAGILRSVRGAHGGVLLARKPQDISLLEVVEACQGLLIGNYCQEIAQHRDPICSFHRAMKELHKATVGVLSKWSLEDLLVCPTSPYPQDHLMVGCKMAFKGSEKYSGGPEPEVDDSGSNRRGRPSKPVKRKR